MYNADFKCTEREKIQSLLSGIEKKVEFLYNRLFKKSQENIENFNQTRPTQSGQSLLHEVQQLDSDYRHLGDNLFTFNTRMT